MFHQSIPTPSTSLLEVGPFTFHFYALCIITGVAVAIWLGDKRLRSINPEYRSLVSEVALIAVPSGIIGGRLYHVITSPDAYFGEGGVPLNAIKIWEGGLGIWGAIAVGALGAWWRLRSLEVSKPPFTVFLDALAPGILFAQAIGRFGNWFNGELFGRPLTAPWALEIPPQLRPLGYESYSTFHPTFLYEAIWCVLLAIALLRFNGKSGQTFALYIVGYCLGRFFIEYLRIDSAHTFAGLRLNNWVAIIVGVSAALWFQRLQRRPR